MSTAYVLGSGFSRHVAAVMPTMKDLVGEVVNRPEIDSRLLSRFSDDLEQWMSYLSVDQPWLSRADNLENRAQFERLTIAVQEIIVSRERDSLSAPAPDWLLQFVWTAADASAPIFTFNYDTLLERALSALRRESNWADLYAVPLTSRVTASGGFLAPGKPRGPIPTIFKLHGSTNWLFSGLDAPPNAPIVLTETVADRAWSSPLPVERDLAPGMSRLHDDLRPLIIPPTFSKGPYFSNQALQAQWRSAAQRLRESEQLAVIGYSFPEGDLVARQWLSTSFDGGRVTVVNPDRAVADRVHSLLGDRAEVDHVRSVDQFVENTCGQLVQWRVALPADERLGLQVDLRVGERDLLRHIDRADPPWNPSDETAQQWLDTLLDRFMPGAMNRSVERESAGGGLRSSRWAMMEEGWQLDETSLMEYLRRA